MELKVEDIEREGYHLVDELRHDELLPFIQPYLRKPNLVIRAYIVLNFGLLTLLSFLIYKHTSGPEVGWEGALSKAFFGFTIAFLLIPLHEYIHALAYKARGARQTSYDVNWAKFYFMAIAHHFVADSRDFRIVALAPVTVITTLLVLAVFLTAGVWQISFASAACIHAALSSGDFALLSYFYERRHLNLITYDDRVGKVSYFYGRQG